MMVVQLKDGRKCEALAQFNRFSDQNFQSGILALVIGRWEEIGALAAKGPGFILSGPNGIGLAEEVAAILFLVPEDYVTLYDDPDFARPVLPVPVELPADLADVPWVDAMGESDADYEVDGPSVAEFPAAEPPAVE